MVGEGFVEWLLCLMCTKRHLGVYTRAMGYLLLATSRTMNAAVSYLAVTNYVAVGYVFPHRQ